jgi:FkbM family methyltransferase
LDVVDANAKTEDAQYFNKISMKTLHDHSITYVDGGAFLGENVVTLADYRRIKQAFLFEPDPENFSTLCGDKRLQSYACYFLPLALCEDNKLMSFQGGQGEASFVGDMGNTEVAAVALDQVMGSNKVDFLKLDVEGGEVNALIGAQKTINRSRPVLAISAYHRPDDLWVIPDLIMQISDGYDFFLRFHGYNTFELVLYAIPTR